MNNHQKISLWKLMILGCLVIVFGCANSPKKLDPSIKGPQIIVNPETIRLGVVKMRDTNIVFEGSGFKPGDSVLIILDGLVKSQAASFIKIWLPKLLRPK